MKIIKAPVKLDELRPLAQNYFGDMIKCVADIKQGTIAIDAELHADLERLLLENGSEGPDLWGFNIYPDEEGDDYIEYDSLINIRAWQGNPGRGVYDKQVRDAIEHLVDKLIVR